MDIKIVNENQEPIDKVLADIIAQALLNQLHKGMVTEVKK